MELGGQAVIEGVLMRNKEKTVIAVRKNKKIVTKSFKYSLLPKLKKPFIRGIIVLIETLILGIKALTWSEQQQEDPKEKTSKLGLSITVIFSLLIAVGLFILLPLYITKLITQQTFLFNLIDGLLRIAIFIGYILAISRVKDVQRLFQYHGAEHKVVNCYEAKKSLTLKNCKKYYTLHPRCGTSFLFIVLIISIIVFSVITSPNFWTKFFGRLLLIPVIASISYELLKLSAKTKKLNFLTYPGLAFQKITTKEPDNKQIQVALTAIKKVI